MVFAKIGFWLEEIPSPGVQGLGELMALPDETLVLGVAGDGAGFPRPPPPLPLPSSFVGDEEMVRIWFILLLARLLSPAICLCLLSLIFFFRLAQTGTGHFASLHSRAWLAHIRMKKLHAVHFPVDRCLQSRACRRSCFILIQNGSVQDESRQEQACIRYSFLFFINGFRASALGWSSSPPMLNPSFSRGCSCVVVL